jgi:indolepyruvate ferredoxin oxidoreductase alpha subunit
VEERLERLRRFSEDFEFNRVEEGDPKLAVIASGVAYQYAREVLPEATFLRLGMAFPFPAEKARAFCERFEEVLVIEEGEPFLEEQLRIHGVRNLVGKEKVPRMGELNPEILAEALLGEPAPADYSEEMPIPPRPPLFCLGCPHRGVFYALKKMMRSGVVALGDIGCYTLGGLPPYSSMQTCFCMGASVGNALGFAKGAGPEGELRPVGVIGDGTFLHGGIAGLIDMVTQRSPATLLICDNSTTAMTGQQPNPASGRTIRGEPAPRVDLEKLLEALGVEFVREVDPYDMQALRKTLRQAIRHPGPAVVLARHPCLMLPEEREKAREPIRFEPERCTLCRACYEFGCPAIGWDDETGPIVDELQCIGCGMCATFCGPGALVVADESPPGACEASPSGAGDGRTAPAGGRA